MFLNWRNTCEFTLPSKSMMVYARANSTFYRSKMPSMRHSRHMLRGCLAVATPQTNSWWKIGVTWAGILVSLLIGVANSRATTAQLRMPAAEPAAARIHPRVVESAGYIAPTPAPLAMIFHSLEERQHVATGDRVVIDAG